MRHGNEEAGGQAASPTGRRLRILVVIMALAIAFALGGVVASRFMVTPAQRDAMADAPPASLLTATVTERELEDAVVTRGDVVALSAVDVLAGRRFAEDPAVITEAPLGTGKEAEAGAVLAEVNGRPVFALPGELPAFHDLAPGATGPLVVQLQDALKTMKLKVDDKPGEFGDSTAAAVGKLYTKAGFPAQETLPMAEVAFLPTLPAKVVSSTLRRGGLASEGSLVLAAGNLVVRVDNPDQQLIALAQKEAPTRLAHELIGEAVDAALQPMQGAAPVEGEASEVAASDDDGTSVTAVPAEPLPLSWLGANVRVTVASATTDGAVLTVPSTAIRVDGAGRAVVTVLADGTQSDVEVTTGFTGGGFVEVSGDIAAGAEVLVGIVR